MYKVYFWANSWFSCASDANWLKGANECCNNQIHTPKSYLTLSKRTKHGLLFCNWFNTSFIFSCFGQPSAHGNKRSVAVPLCCKKENGFHHYAYEKHECLFTFLLLTLIIFISRTFFSKLFLSIKFVIEGFCLNCYNIFICSSIYS